MRNFIDPRRFWKQKSYKDGRTRLIFGILLALMLQFPAFEVYSQARRTVSGVIKDERGEVLPGASVVVKGSMTGTSADANGKFSLSVSASAKTLIVSFVGCEAQEIDLTGGGAVLGDIALKSAPTALEEVVIVGYGSSTKRSLVTSVAKLPVESLSKLPASNITQSLAGRAPGLIIQSGSGLNSQASISIRGGGDPIYVVDGIIRSRNDFANTNAEDIESITILKDASSTAVYGARATNGIVQVTTKSGKSGIPQVTYSLNQTWGQPSFWAKRVSSYENAKRINEARANEGLDPQFSNEQLEKYRTGTDPGEYPNTDWKELVLKKWAPMTKHNISLSGGTEFNTYYTSLGYTDMNSLFKSGRYKVDRVNYTISNTTNIKPIGLKITGQLSGFVESKDDVYSSEGGGNGYIMWMVAMKSSTEIGVNKYGLPYNVSNNPVADASQDAGYMRSKDNVINGLLNIEWALPWVEGLSLKASGNYNWYDANRKNWRKDAGKYAWDSKTPRYASKPELSLGDGQGLNWTLQYFANYNKEFGYHSISALAGYEASYKKDKSMGLLRKNYELPIDQIPFGPTDDMTTDAWEAESGRAGYIAQLKYGFKSKYYIEGAYRHDGSDVFPKENRWGNFFSISTGWILSNESFMQTIKDKNIFNLLKLKASFGEVGMDVGIDRYSYMNTYDYDAKGYVFNGKMFPTLKEGSVPSKDITWYKDKQYGAGFDFESLKSSVYGSFDYYLFVTSGYMAAPDGKSVGYVAPFGRALPKTRSQGEKRRAGFDFQLGYRNHIGDFKYDIALNFTKYDIYWASYPWESLDVKKNPYTRQTGQYEHFSQTAYHYIKTASGAKEWMNYPQQQGAGNLSGGDFIYEDFNGDGRITAEDQYRVGYAAKPLINYGIPINLAYRGFTINLLFQGAGKRDLPINKTLWSYNYLTRYDYQLDYWRPDNQKAKFPRILSSQSVNGQNNLLSSEAWTFNGSYFRLKSLSIGYNFKYELLKKMPWVKTCNIALIGQNLLTFSDATKYGIDPEVSDVISSYPIERVIGININVGF